MNFEDPSIVQFYQTLTQQHWAYIVLSRDEARQMYGWLVENGHAVSHHNDIWVIDKAWATRSDAWYKFSERFSNDRTLLPEDCGISRAQ